MNGPARLFLTVAIVMSAANHAYGQANSRPAPAPAVTAQHEPWYVNGEPVPYAGNIYYPAGPHAHFNRYEMVRSGSYRGIPLYTRTTIEPFSLIFIPIDGGLMQPYERRRAGDVAGTVGSTAPSFPVVTPSEEGLGTTALTVEMLQAPAPPIVENYLGGPPAKVMCVPPIPAAPRCARRSGPMPPAPGPQPMRSANRPEGLNGVFVDFNRRRYFSSGATVLFGRGTFQRIGEHHGLPVYLRRGDPRTIYIPVQPGAELLARYSRRR